MIFELFEDTLKMSFIVFCLYAVFRAYVRLRQPAWSIVLERRRLAILSALVLAVLALKVTEDVLGGESGPIDRANDFATGLGAHPHLLDRHQYPMSGTADWPRKSCRFTLALPALEEI